MIWREWATNDNYAENGTIDLERLDTNLRGLAAVLAADFNIIIPLPVLPLNGYATLPFADFLQAVENNVNAAKVFSSVNWPPSREWQPGAAITAADPNRWEQSGALLEQNIERGRRNMLKCGRFACGRR